MQTTSTTHYLTHPKWASESETSCNQDSHSYCMLDVLLVSPSPVLALGGVVYNVHLHPNRRSPSFSRAVPLRCSKLRGRVISCRYETVLLHFCKYISNWRHFRALNDASRHVLCRTWGLSNWGFKVRPYGDCL